MRAPSRARATGFLLLMAGLLGGCASEPRPAAPSPGASASPEGSALDAYLERTVPFGFSGAFLVARNGEVVLHQGYGLADRERRVPVSAETVFDIGSITKQFTAAAILKLEEQGRLRVDDPITRFFSGVPAEKAGITLHHLLTHTSGLTGDLGRDYEVMPRDSLVRLALTSELQWEPGTRYDYSNVGYSLLGAVIELASGQPYEAYLHEHLWRPAGMSRTGYVIPRWSPDELAVGYRGGQRWGTPLDHAWAPDGPWWNLRANGGILSTLGDLYRWHRALEGDAVLGAASRQRLFTPHVPEDAEGQSHYGYGWAISTTGRGTRLVWHNGGNGYFFADFLRYVDEEVVVILATNQADREVAAVRGSVLRAVFGEKELVLPPSPATQLSAAALERYAGTYELPSGAGLVVSLQDGRLTVDAAGQEAAELLMGTTGARLATHRELSDRAERVIGGMSLGDFEPLQAASANADATRNTIQRIWRQAEESLGEYRGFEVLGTVPAWWSEEPSLATFVRLRFERGSRLFRLHWAGEQIVGIGGSAIPNPARTTLLPQGEHAFVGYNLGIEHAIPVRFEVEGAGTAGALLLRSPAGEQTARRRGD